jgi:hypothetical protein
MLFVIVLVIGFILVSAGIFTIGQIATPRAPVEAPRNVAPPKASPPAKQPESPEDAEKRRQQEIDRQNAERERKRRETEIAADKKLTSAKSLLTDISKTLARALGAVAEEQVKAEAEAARLRGVYKENLQKVIAEYPDTKAAIEAKKLLARER